MARVPAGKLLLRNVIRHTDAHNKIQEESEMWKLRDMERQTSSTCDPNRRWTTRSSMHCDRYMNDSEGSTRSRPGERGSLSLRDEQEARYWTRKLYDFEDNDPDRWGHSGFKELYPEEFQSDRESDDRKPRRDLDKKSKRSAKKKKKKTKKKKQRTEESDSESDSSAAHEDGSKPKTKSSRSRHRRKKKVKDRDDSGGAGEKTNRKRSRTGTRDQREPERKKRTWRAANEEKSDLSSDN